MAELTYARYLRLEELLALQKPVSDPPEHDETLFIIIHQTYELWFKQLLHELEALRGRLDAGDLFPAMHVVKRARTIMKVLVAQTDILETMTPLSFASFRDRLDTASGFQSLQFRELEFLLGLKRSGHLARYPEGSQERVRLEARLHEPSVAASLVRFLGEIDPPAIDRQLVGEAMGPLDEPTRQSPELQEALLRCYRERPDVALLLELLCDFDEGLQEWRYRHVKMVERTIGHKMGTGGSSGVDFLKATLFKPVFPDLWAIRDRF